MFKKSILTVAIGAVGFFAKAASTLSVSYTTTIATAATDWTNTVALTQFNPSLGTLDSIQLSLSTGVSTILSLTNTASSTSTGYGTTLFEVFFNNDYNLFGSSSATNQVLNVMTPYYAFSLSPQQGMVSGLLQTNASISGPAITSRSTLNAFTGTGTLDFTASTLTVAGIFSSGGNIVDSQATQGGLTAVITYNFTAPVEPLPEPSTFALLGASLAGFGLFRRHHLKK